MAPSSKSDVHIALLRGINVAGKNKLPMQDLAAMFREAGCEDVRTYIQSGNVIFRTSRAHASRLSGAISTAIDERLGLRVPVITRTAAELRTVASANPFLRSPVDTKRLHVVFLARKPTAASIAALDPDRSPPDELVVGRHEIYLHCPRGMGRTKLTNDYFDRTLSTTSTVRNWRTVLELVELSSG